MAAIVTGLMWAIDVTIALTLVGLAALALATADLFRGIVFFMALGLMMAMAWARLQAIDIALAEAAIGAGLTGALLLNALRHLPEPRPRAERTMGRRQRALRLGILGLAGALAIAMALAIWALPSTFSGVAPYVMEALPRSGVGNPVTAVLLNFRAYDTLLEVAVLVLALAGVWALGPGPRDATAAAPGPVLHGLVYVLVPSIGVVAGYLLWAGTRAPGGAFQAGALLAAAGVLLIVVRLFDPAWLQQPLPRTLMALGVVGFLGVGIAGLVLEGQLLRYPVAQAGSLILAVEALLTIAIALLLVALFAGGVRTDDAGHARDGASGSPGTGGDARNGSAA